MRRTWSAALALLLGGCGAQPSGVRNMGEAPTGVAPGVTLYFVDAQGRLEPRRRQTDRLGTIPEAMSLLLSGPGIDSGLRTEIAPSRTGVAVNVLPGLIHLRVPLALYEVTPRGIDQIVCTALGVSVQGGGPKTTKVQILFTTAGPESDQQRTCPLIG